MQSDVSPSAQFMDLLKWVQQHRRQVLTWTAVAVAVGLVVGLFLYQQSQREGRASRALSEVRVPLGLLVTNPPGLVEGYLKVARDHAGTRAAARAILNAAGWLYADGRAAEAQTQFERLAKEYPDSQWLAEAALGVAACLEAQGKTNEALAKYEEVRKRYASSAIIDQVKLDLGRLYERQNRPADAHKLYDELVTANPYGGLGSEAGMRREELEEKHPELKKTNAPPPAPVPPVVATNRPPATTTRTIMLTNIVRPAATNVPPTGTNLLRVATNAASALVTNAVPPPGTGAPAATATNPPLLLKPATTNKP
jgi:tetratricopeptide (TPR) repeat protein